MTRLAHKTRRSFLADIGRGAIAASVGLSLAADMGLSHAWADEDTGLDFGDMEPLVRLMQETPIDRLQTTLVQELRSGRTLKDLTAAGALANARTFGGEDYVGFHTLMAISPAFSMSAELPAERAALPVLKVLYRNTNRIQEFGGRAKEVLKPTVPSAAVSAAEAGEAIRAACRAKDLAGAEAILAGNCNSPEAALDAVLYAVDDQTEVHRVVLPYRAWDLLHIIGPQHAHTMLRQSIHYCVKAPVRPIDPTADDVRTVLPALFDQYKLAEKSPGDRQMDDAWVESFSMTLFSATPVQAADAAAAALAEGIAPGCIAEAISLAANQLVLRDHGRTPQQESPGKPVGSVHGDSIGVHACDSANAWRNMAKVSGVRNQFACLILGAYQVALDRAQRGGDFLNWEPVPVKWQLDRITSTDPKVLLTELDAAVRDNLQSQAAAIVTKMGELGHSERPILDTFLKYAISEDGSLHAEKYYRTVSEEFAITRASFRWRQLQALARVTASEYGRPAPGYNEACALIGT